MTTYRCRDCGYFLAESSAPAGALRVVCRRCRRVQLVRLVEPSPARAAHELTGAAAQDDTSRNLTCTPTG